MATQTRAQVEAEISARIAIFEELRKHAHVNSSGALSNYIAREVTALATTQGDRTRQSNVELAGYRGLLASAIDNSFLRRILDPLVHNYSAVLSDSPSNDIGTQLRELYLDFIDNTRLVKSRNINFGSISAGSNLGDGTINRLTVDAYGYDIEACHMEAKKARCVRDETLNGEEHEEVFLFEGAKRNVDQLQVAGSGAGVLITAMSARNSLITNASFTDYGGTALTSLTEISGWTPGAETISNYNLTETAAEIYRGAGGTSDATPRAVKFLNNGSLTQNFDVNNIKLTDDIPIYGQLAYNRSVGSCDGTLTLQVGNNSVSVDLGGASSGYQVLRLPLNKLLYPRNFANLDEPVVKITLSGRTTGTLLIDDVIIGPMRQFDGTWYAVVGAATPFVAGNRDVFTWTDALTGSDSIIQQWLWRIYGFYLPHTTGGGEDWADPSV